ncbi:MAG: hypothetical protein ABIA04_14855 [Pseudomonadota bacterium]
MSTRKQDVSIQYLIFAATQSEIDRLIKLLDNKKVIRIDKHLGICGSLEGKNILIIKTGVGYKIKKTTIDKIINDNNPKSIIITGFCASFRKNIKIGHIVLSEIIINDKLNEIKVNENINNNTEKAALEIGIPIQLGQTLSVSELLDTKEIKERYKNKYHEAIACDMENHHLANIMKNYNIPFVSIRAVSDTLSQDLPISFSKEIEEETRKGFISIIKYIFKHPKRFYSVIRFHKNLELAQENFTRLIYHFIKIN